MAMSLNPSESTVVVKKSPKALVKNYAKDIVALGYGEETNNRNGLRIPINEENFNKLQVPNAEDEGTKTGIFKTEFVTDNGFVGHSLYIMYRANPTKVKEVTTSIGIPSPKQARTEVQEAEEDYPEY